MRILLFFALSCHLQFGLSQFYDDFSSHSLSNWQGDSSLFIINPIGQLQLNGAHSNVATLYRTVDSMPNNMWQGSVHLHFPPSSSNKLKIILAQFNYPDTSEVYLEIGESGNMDSLKFIFSSPTSTKRYRLGNPFLDDAHFIYKIIYESPNWFIQLDYDNEVKTLDTISHKFKLIFPFQFGLHCSYTSTRSDKFFFDEIAVGIEKIDTIPPLLLYHEVIDSQTILFRFNEKINLSPSLKYISIEPIIKINSVITSGDSSEVIVYLDEPLISGQNYTINFPISDLLNNIDILLIKVKYYKIKLAQPGELIITEIMADPSPPLALPECEYLELYNRSNHFFRLSDYTLADDRKQIFLPDSILSPFSYVVLIDQKCQSSFRQFKNVIPVESLPTFNNDGDHLQILDYVGRDVFEVNFSRDWYDIEDQSQGGWSLEMIDVNQPCLGNSNWTAAEFHACGSPGMENSVNNSSAEVKQIKIKEIQIINTETLQINFDKRISTNVRAIHIEITPQLIEERRILSKDKSSVTINFKNEFVQGQSYSLFISNIFDCTLQPNDSIISAKFFLPISPRLNDISINEVLFNPSSGGVDFIEISNNTNQFIRLDELCIENQSTDDTSFVCWTEYSILPPNSFLGLTSDTGILKQHYTTGDLWEVELPKFPDHGGSISIFNYENQKRTILDSVLYSPDMHNPILISDEGVSLEKSFPVLHPELGTWSSASSQVGFATPGLKNSLEWIEARDEQNVLGLIYDQFSPNQDGYFDALFIDISLPKNGFNARIDIFDLAGRRVFRLLDDALINGTSRISWFGNTVRNGIASPGIYILLGQFVHPDGDLICEKITCVVN